MCLKSSRRARSPSIRVSIRGNGGDGGDKKDVRDACDEMCVCKTVFPRQVVARYIASPRVNQSGWITIRANTSGVFSTLGESSLPVPVCARISLIRDGIYYRSLHTPRENSILRRSDPIRSSHRYRKIYSNQSFFFHSNEIYQSWGWNTICASKKLFKSIIS